VDLTEGYALQVNRETWQTVRRRVRGRRLIGDFVVAGCAAALTVEKAVFTKPDIQLALTTTVLLTFATFFDLFALTAAGFGLGGHKQTVAPKALPRERAVGN
jgi:hypothetical protein